MRSEKKAAPSAAFFIDIRNMTQAQSELAELANLLRIEQQEDAQLHELFLRKKTIQERRLTGLTWFPLRIAETGYGLGAYPFIVVENPGDKHRHQFQSSSPVKLFSAVQGNEGEYIKGTIGYVDDSRMKIFFTIDDLPEWVDDGKLGVDLMFDSKSYDEMFAALNVLINAEKGRVRELREILLGGKTPEFEFVGRSISKELNASQNEAVQSIANALDLAVIHGPPGTGKTTTLVHAARELSSPENQWMMCAPSNAAADHLTRSLAASGLNVVRIGNLAKIEEEATGHTLDALLQQEKEFKQIRELKRKAIELKKIGGKYKRSFGREEAEQRKLIFKEARELHREARDLEKYLVGKILDKAQVVTCTLIGSRNDFIADRKWHTVVIDEAGQGLEPATWVPILAANRVVLAGDPFQLPPTVKSREASVAGLSITLLEKAIAHSPNVQLLRTQYRMNNTIMEFSNRRFYEGRLEAHPSVANWHLQSSPAALEFIDTAGSGYEEVVSENSESRCNPGEVSLVRLHLNTLLSNPLNDFSIAVISPYRAQIELLEEELAPMHNVSVNTIDSFQGQERDVIYLSLVRSNDRGEIGFLKDYRRMNVAMTRARKKLVVIGDSATIGNDSFYNAFLTYCEEIGAYKTAWEFIV